MIARLKASRYPVLFRTLFVPSELPAAWVFHANAPNVSASCRGAIRASIIGFLSPAAAALGLAVRGADRAFRVAVVFVTLANLTS